MTKIEVIRETIYSKILNKDYDYKVIKDKNGGSRNNLLFVTDGDYWLDVMKIDKLIFNKLGLKNFVIVALSQKNRNIELPYNLNFAKFISFELKDEISKKLNICKWIFFGNSYGALCGLNISTLYDNVFDIYICQSPSIYLDTIENESRNAQLYEKGFHNNVYISYGSTEDLKFKNPIKNLFSKNKQVNLYEFNGGHDYNSWKNDLKIFLCKLNNIKN